MFSSLACNICDVKRLQILENAVIHYGGGILSLERRALEDVNHVKDSYPEVAKTLGDITNYLSDIIEVARLRERYDNENY